MYFPGIKTLIIFHQFEKDLMISLLGLYVLPVTLDMIHLESVKVTDHRRPKILKMLDTEWSNKLKCYKFFWWEDTTR